MSDLAGHVRSVLWWIVPLVVLAIAVGWEVDWGAAVRKRPPPEEALTPKPVNVDLLPNYAIEGGLAARSETVSRPLFNPTRRPAPVAIETSKPRMQRGQYALTGTTVAGERSLAFLKEINGGKARTVRKGDSINGMLVAEVSTDRVKLALGDETEELVLRVVTNPKPTPQPPPPTPAAPGAAVPGTPAAAPAQQAQPQTQPSRQPQAQTTAQTLAERRRAARAAEAAASAAAQNPSDGTAAPADGWQQMDERYRRRAQQGAGK